MYYSPYLVHRQQECREPHLQYRHWIGEQQSAEHYSLTLRVVMIHHVSRLSSLTKYCSHHQL